MEVLTDVMQPHTEQYEHLGEVRGYVYDLRPFWTHQREQRRIVVDPEAAWLAAEMVLPAAPPLIWVHLNEPERKRLWREADAIRVLGESKRMGVGTVHHCVHGTMTIVEQIVDWRPFEYVTVSNGWPMQASALDTTHLLPQEDGTRLVCYVGRPNGKNRLHTALVRLAYAFLKKRLLTDYTKSLNNLRTMLEADQAIGTVSASFEQEPVLE